MYTYSTKGTCSRQIIFNVDEQNNIHDVRFIGGCGGNLQGIARLVEGKNLDEIADVMEVLFAIANKYGYSEKDLLDKRNDKKTSRGGFEKNIVLKKTY